MKLTKKLFPAIGMLLLSACMLVTSTFAWFSMNEKVDATGMNVSAKGEQIYLQISKAKFTADDNGKKLVDIDFSGDSLAELFPAAIMANTTTAYESGDDFIWVSAKGTDAENGTKEGNYTQVESLDDYRLEKTMYVRLDPTAGADKANNPLKVMTVKFADGQVVNEMAQCISVMVVGDECAQLFKYEGGQFTETTNEEDELIGDGKLTAGAFDEMGDGLEVKVYIYFDGDNELCTLQNLAKAKAEGGVNQFAIDIVFSCQ